MRSIIQRGTEEHTEMLRRATELRSPKTRGKGALTGGRSGLGRLHTMVEIAEDAQTSA